MFNSDINHALTKLPAKTWEECKCTLESSNFPAEDWSENSKSILENEGVYCLNNVCEAVRRLHDESTSKNCQLQCKWLMWMTVGQLLSLQIN